MIGLARHHFANDPHYIFPRRVITRDAQKDAEDHETLSVEDFERAKSSGQFALQWDAHGLRYGVTQKSLEPVFKGATAILNVSRKIIAKAEAIDARVTVLSIKCRPELLAQRIAGRGRESAEEIVRRLQREAPFHVSTARLIEITNETDPLDIINDVINAIQTA